MYSYYISQATKYEQRAMKLWQQAEKNKLIKDVNTRHIFVWRSEKAAEYAATMAVHYYTEASIAKS